MPGRLTERNDHGHRMKVLITGNLGYVGPLVVEHLSTAGQIKSIIGLDAGWFADACIHDAVPTDLRVQQRFGDIRQTSGEDLREIDSIIHLAAVSNDPMGRRFEQSTRAINGRETVAFASRAKAAGVSRFVFASSCSLYGAAGNRMRIEADPLDPLTPYAQGKADAELGLRELADPDFQVVSLRFATACGWSPRFRSDLVLNDFVLTAWQTGRIKVLSDGSPWRPLIHVSDMGRAMTWAVVWPMHQSSPWAVFNVGRPDMNVQIADLAHHVARCLGDTEVDFNTDAAPDQRSYSVDFTEFSRHAPADLLKLNLDAAVRDVAENVAHHLPKDGNSTLIETVRLNSLERLVADGILNQALERVPV